MGTPVSSTNKTDHQDITDILLKVALNTINLILNLLHNEGTIQVTVSDLRQVVLHQ
jgi:hypothetical protein